MHSNDFRRISEAHCKFVSISSWVLILPLKFYEKSADTQLNQRCPKGSSAESFIVVGMKVRTIATILMATSNMEYRSNRITISIPRAVLPQPVQSSKIPSGIHNH